MSDHDAHDRESTDAADALAKSRRDSTKLPEPSPDSTGELPPSAIVHGRKRRLRLVMIAAVTTIAGLVAVLVIADRRATAKADARINVAWSSLSRCLIGEPVRPGERPSVRFRRVQLVAMAMPVDKRRGADGEPWPATCAAYAFELDRALRDGLRAEKAKVTGEPGLNPNEGKNLAGTSESLATTLQKTPKTESLDLSATIDRLYERATAEKMVLVSVTNVPMPPQGAVPLDADALAAVGSVSKTSFSLDHLFSESHGDRALRFIADGAQPPSSRRFCTLTDEKSARCTPMPEKVAPMGELHLLGTVQEGASPLLFTGKRGAGGIFRSDDGERIDALYSFGAVVLKDKSIALVSPLPPPPPEADEKKHDEKSRDSRLRILRAKPGAAPTISTLMLPEGADPRFHTATIVWDQLLWKAKKDGSVHLFAQKIDGDTLAAPIDVGTAEGQAIEPGETVPAVEGCKTADGTFVRLGGAAHHIAFLGKDGWKPPIPSGGYNAAMTCRGTEATFTAMSSREKSTTWRLTITQDRCTPTECKFNRALIEMSSELAPPDNGQLAAVDLDGKLLVVWTAGTRGGIRMRLANIRDIATTPDTVIFDDQMVGGKNTNTSVLHDFLVFGQEKYALLVLDTTQGVYLMRIDPSGSVSTVDVK